MHRSYCIGRAQARRKGGLALCSQVSGAEQPHAPVILELHAGRRAVRIKRHLALKRIIHVSKLIEGTAHQLELDAGAARLGHVDHVDGHGIGRRNLEAPLAAQAPNS